MGRTVQRLLTIVIAASIPVLMSGCGVHQDFDYSAADEIPPGPGLFSGEDGVFTILREDIWSGSRRRGGGRVEKAPEETD